MQVDDAEAPVAAEKYPPAQGVHATVEELLANVPAGHSEQLAAPAAE